MVRLIKQLLRIVLAVDVDQIAAQLFQNANRHRLAVDPADVFSIQKNLPLDQKFPAVVWNPVFGKPVILRYAGKQCTDPGGRTARPNHIPVGALTQNGRNCVDHNGFARTGFTGQNVEPAAEPDFRLFNDRNILNMQNIQHGSHSLPSQEI